MVRRHATAGRPGRIALVFHCSSWCSWHVVLGIGSSISSSSQTRHEKAPVTRRSTPLRRDARPFRTMTGYLLLPLPDSYHRCDPPRCRLARDDGRTRGHVFGLTLGRPGSACWAGYWTKDTSGAWATHDETAMNLDGTKNEFRECTVRVYGWTPGQDSKRGINTSSHKPSQVPERSSVRPSVLTVPDAPVDDSWPTTPQAACRRPTASWPNRSRSTPVTSGSLPSRAFS